MGNVRSLAHPDPEKVQRVQHNVLHWNVAERSDTGLCCFDRWLLHGSDGQRYRRQRQKKGGGVGVFVNCRWCNLLHVSVKEILQPRRQATCHQNSPVLSAEGVYKRDRYHCLHPSIWQGWCSHQLCDCASPNKTFGCLHLHHGWLYFQPFTSLSNASQETIENWTYFILMSLPSLHWAGQITTCCPVHTSIQMTATQITNLGLQTTWRAYSMNWDCSALCQRVWTATQFTQGIVLSPFLFTSYTTDFTYII